MRNLPPDFQSPPTAVGISKALVVTTVATHDGQNLRESVEADVLAVGWSGNNLSYLVYDQLHNEVFWVAEESVQALRTGR